MWFNLLKEKHINFLFKIIVQALNIFLCMLYKSKKYIIDLFTIIFTLYLFEWL